MGEPVVNIVQRCLRIFLISSGACFLGSLSRVYMFLSYTNLKEIVFGDTRTNMGKMRFFFACLLLFTMLLSFTYAAITTESPLSIGQTLSSSNNVYELGFFSPNNSQSLYVGIWFKGIIPRVVVWVANRENPVTDSTANLAIGSNGSLLLSNGKHGVIWSIGETFASNGSRAELSDSGDLFLIDNASRRTLWQSFEHLGDTMLPYSSLMYNLATGEKRVLTSWKSYTDPSPGEFVGQITPQVPSQGFIMRGSKPYWRSGPWAKTRFTGLPLTDESYRNPFSLQQDANGSGYFSHLQRNYNRPFVVLTSEGSLKLTQHNGTDWVLSFEVPANSCDFYGICGPFGLCVMSIPPKCKCFKGFVPQYSEEWKRGNWTGGCMRRTELHCQGNSTSKDVNVLYPVANIKPPDFYEFVYSGSAEECYQSCLHNCSCLAVSYIHGIGCLMWSQELMDVVQFSAGGELLFIRLARSEMGGNSRKKTITASIVSLSLFVILGSSAFGFWRYRLKHNVSANISKVVSQGALRNDLKPEDIPGLYFFEMKTIEVATNNFSLLNKLGQGGFGSVYKGKLQDGKDIAVKRLSSSSRQGKEEFMNEIVLISKLQHRNLVRILGCCIEGDERLLIYEFMVNKSLDTFIFDSRKRLEIDWPKRFNIIQGIARGLLYLHRDSRLRVIHRDLKVSNILLDEKMNPKISDFGLARMYQGTQYLDKTRRVVGTLGYMSPEYAWTGVFSEKSDTYSFGVLLLEIISGEKISRFSDDEECKSLLAYAWESWCGNGGVDFLDKNVADSCNPSEVGRCVQIGLLCVQHQPVERPNTLELLSMLTTTSDLPPPKEPTFAVHTSDDGSRANDLITVNEVTQSVVLGR
ncbi:G-type lectin S-receptor-like serine/threonine-protein kinase At1g61550 [Arabidopsis lyrata subsp. lyrata]|uniref:G-type lectin S-receptor-like serine/threonine-protein kinase At1g61550 n=1 Tax=Arabidopsis lyrata subsp. lyrata TaxID=81972 RepID=UPI000A29E8B8|nr:G-type lectin S-receptor-like serine/threonine-protein kinase At1g61550 [Arabidopsis lyrata subsp. lyrata]|eukprot:XP_020890039.1 G-type lectin S-receptor-like serine/threonine-protein kinase At1g61550 [Arabidopsis lyrata subsp. lyrata]